MFNLKSPPIIIEDSFVSRHILYKKRMRAFKPSCFFSSLIFEGPCHETAKKLQASLLLVNLTTAVYSAVSLTSLKKFFDATDCVKDSCFKRDIHMPAIKFSFLVITAASLPAVQTKSQTHVPHFPTTSFSKQFGSS